MKQLILLIASLTLCVGCKARLEPGGAYAPIPADSTNAQPDMAFYAVDSAFELADKSIDFIFKFEADNRDLLWTISPDIKHGLDAIRPTAVQIRHEYIAARIVYKAQPTPANLDGVQRVLAKLQQLLSVAETVMISHQPKPQASVTPAPGNYTENLLITNCVSALGRSNQ